jgi:hypothetical protein
MIAPIPAMKNSGFALLASDAQIERTVACLETNNIHAIIAENGTEARKQIVELIPPNAEVFTANSATLDALGIKDALDQSGRYQSVRAALAAMDPKIQNRAMQRLGATPEYMIGSVHAVTETGRIIIASKTGSQLAGYASGAAHLIWVVGTQKIVPTLEDGLRRVEEYALPLEDARVMKAFGFHSSINKLLIINQEFRPGRSTMILVKENLGF